jgi:alpha-L-fucosidase
MLIRSAGGDGNVLLNVGPRPDGMIDPEQANRLKEIGDWLAKYGESIYATRGGPYKPAKHIATTRKANTIYLHILTWPEDTLKLPALPAKIVKATALTGGTADVKQTDTGLEVRATDHQPIDTIVALELDRPTIEIEPISIKTGNESLTTGKKAKASNVYQKSNHFAAAKACDDEKDTRWATDAGTKTAWLEVDLGKAETFDRALIDEWEPRIRSFELQAQDGKEWKTFRKGTTAGHKFEVKFDPVTAQHIRLNILDATNGPTLNEFQLFAPKK